MFNLLLKDIKNIVYDKKTLAMIIIMPVVLMSILGAALKDMFSDDMGSGVQFIEIGIVKEYDYALEKEKFESFLESGFLQMDGREIDLKEIDPEKIFMKDFLEDEELKKFLKHRIMTREEGEKLLGEDQLSALVILPKNYIYNSYMNLAGPGRNLVEMQMIKNTQRQFSADMAEQIINGFLKAFNGVIAKKTVLIESMIRYDILEEDMSELFQSMDVERAEAVEISVKQMSGGEEIDSFQYYSAAIMTMFLLYVAGIGGRALLEEKNEHTLQRLEVSGAGILKIAISNLLRIMMIAILQSMIMILYSKVALGVEWGDPFTVSLTMLCSSFAVGGLGMLVSVITVVTDRYFASNVFEWGVVQLMALVGGSFIPIEILPKAIQKLEFIALNGVAMKMYLNGIAYVPISENLIYIISLLAMGGVFILFSLLIIRTRKRRVIA